MGLPCFVSFRFVRLFHFSITQKARSRLQYLHREKSLGDLKKQSLYKADPPEKKKEKKRKKGITNKHTD